VAAVLEEAGITFAWAAAFHPGFKHAGRTRAELGVATVFNYLGPLVNPARAEANAVGVSQPESIPLITGVFRTRGATALVFRGEDGLDELSTTGYSRIWQITNGDMHEFDVHPSYLGVPTPNVESLLGGTPEHNAEVLRRTLAGEQGAGRDLVLCTAAAGLVSYRRCQDPGHRRGNRIPRVGGASDEAAAAIADGRAPAKLGEWVSATPRCDAE